MFSTNLLYLGHNTLSFSFFAMISWTPEKETKSSKWETQLNSSAYLTWHRRILLKLCLFWPNKRFKCSIDTKCIAIHLYTVLRRGWGEFALIYIFFDIFKRCFWGKNWSKVALFEPDTPHLICMNYIRLKLRITQVPLAHYLSATWSINYSVRSLRSRQLYMQSPHNYTAECTCCAPGEWPQRDGADNYTSPDPLEIRIDQTLNMNAIDSIIGLFKWRKQRVGRSLARLKFRYRTNMRAACFWTLSFPIRSWKTMSSLWPRVANHFAIRSAK